MDGLVAEGNAHFWRATHFEFDRRLKRYEVRRFANSLFIEGGANGFHPFGRDLHRARLGPLLHGNRRPGLGRRLDLLKRESKLIAIPLDLEHGLVSMREDAVLWDDSFHARVVV